MTALRVRNLGARYGDHIVLANVDLTIERGEWFCLLGPNGVGKSTLLHCVAGRLKAASGEVSIENHSLRKASRAAKRALGFACSPEEAPPLLTGRQCLEIYASAKGLTDIDADVIAIADRLRFTAFLDKCVDTYSLGTRQKLCILLALLGDPALIVLDESFNGLDPASALLVKRELRARLAAGRSGLLLATHSLDIVEHYADRAALMLEGRIAREWSRAELDALRAQGANAFEEALAAQSG